MEMADGLSGSLRTSRDNGNGKDYRTEIELASMDRKSFASPTRSNNNGNGSHLPRRLPTVSSPPTVTRDKIPVTVEYHASNTGSLPTAASKSMPSSKSWPADDSNGASNFGSYRNGTGLSPEHKPPNYPRTDALKEETGNGPAVVITANDVAMTFAQRSKSPDSVSQVSDVVDNRSRSARPDNLRGGYGSNHYGNSRETPGISYGRETPGINYGNARDTPALGNSYSNNSTPTPRPGSAVSGVSDGLFGGHFDGVPQISSGRRSPGSHSVASTSSATTVIVAEGVGGMQKGAPLDRQTRQTLGAILQEISMRAKSLLAKDDFTTEDTVGDLNFLAHQSRYNADSGVKRRLLHRLAECSILDIFVKVFKSVHSVDALFTSGGGVSKSNSSGDHRHSHIRSNSSAASDAGDLDVPEDPRGEEDLYAEVRSSAASPAMQNLVSITTCLWHVNEKSPAVCEDSIRRGVIQVLLRDLDDPRLLAGELTKDPSRLYLVRGYLGIFYSILKFFLDARELFRDFGAVRILKSYLKTTSALVRLKVLLVLSYVITEVENDELNAGDKNISLMVKALHSALESDVHHSKKYRCWAGEVAAGLNRLALCDSNKERIMRKSILPLYVRLLDPLTANEEEHMVAAQGLWSLLFCDEARRSLRADPACKLALETLEKATQRDEVRRAVRGALFIICGRWNSPRSQLTASMAVSPSSDVGVTGHVMISFHQSSKPVVLRLREKIRSAGYRIWMDIEGIQSLDVMADAMEKCSVVLVCMSQRYKDSAACRTELEFAQRLRKEFVAVVVHPKFSPDGWLARALGGRRVVDMSSDDSMDTALTALVQQLGSRGFRDSHDGARSIITYAPSVSSVLTENMALSPKTQGWSCDDVLHWLQDNDLTHLADRFRRINGDLLTEITRMHQRAPEHFYRTLRDDLQMDFVTVLKFTRALGRL